LHMSDLCETTIIKSCTSKYFTPDIAQICQCQIYVKPTWHKPCISKYFTPHIAQICKCQICVKPTSHKYCTLNIPPSAAWSSSVWCCKETYAGLVEPFSMVYLSTMVTQIFEYLTVPQKYTFALISQTWILETSSPLVSLPSR
jgi:hypothetical protein